MKLKKLFTSLMIASVGMNLLVGCSSQDKAISTEENSVEKEESLENIQTEEFKLPLTEEVVELTYAGYDSWYPPASYTQNLPVWQEVEKRTNVKIKWEVMPPDQYKTSIQTRLAAGKNLPDIMAVTGDAVKLSQNGTILPLSKLIKKNAPHVQDMFKKWPVVEKSLTAPDGEIYTCAEVFVEGNEVAPKSFIIRYDWLEKLGLEEPKTLDDWYNVLKAFKEKDPNGNGKADEIPMISHYGIGEYGLFGSAFGLTSPVQMYWYDEEGKVYCQYTTPEFKEFLTFLNKLYKEGLIDPQYATQDEAKSDAMISKDIVGVSAHFAGVDVRWDNILHNGGVAEADFRLVHPPIGKDGEQPKLIKRSPIGLEFAITKDCENPDVAMKWIDYIWASDEGITLTHFGIEGKSYEVNAEGRPQLSEWALNNPDGLDPFSAVRSLGAFPSLFDTQTKEFMSQTMAQKSLDAAERLFPIMVEPFPEVIATNEEANKLISLSADIDTYIDEMIQKFVMGTEPLEKFDSFIAQLEGMGLNEMVSIKQTQYDRYMGVK